MTSTEILLLITGVTTMVVSIVNSIAAGWGREATKNAKNELVEHAVIADKKLDSIHDLADGNLSKVTASLNLANEKIAGLEKLVFSLVERPPGDHQSLTKGHP